MDPYDDVDRALDDARLDLGAKWVDIAERAGISAATLLRYRKGEQRTPDTTRALERVWGWPRGYLDAIGRGDEPPAVEPEQPPAAQPVDTVSELEQLSEFAATLERQVAELRRRIAAVTHDEQQQRRAQS